MGPVKNPLAWSALAAVVLIAFAMFWPTDEPITRLVAVLQAVPLVA